jgi:general secretion pathway protein K
MIFLYCSTPTPDRPSGAAVVSVMALVMVCAALAGAVMWKSNLGLSRTENQRDTAQARWIARAAVDYARWVLATDSIGLDPAANTLMDHLYEPWAQRIPTTSLDQLFESRTAGLAQQDLQLAAFGGQVTDEQARFNLGRMVFESQLDPREVRRFELLLESVGLKSTQITELIQTLQKVAISDATSPLRQPRHRTVEQLIAGLGLPEDQRQRLNNVITWLPRSTPVNVNTASPEVIAVMVGGDSRAIVDRLIEARQRAPFRDIAEINAALAGTIPVSSNELDVKSSFFRAEGLARFGRLELSFKALLMRQGGQVMILDYREN